MNHLRVLNLNLIALAVLAALTRPAFAQDHAEIDKSSIIGNRELPKVLYIVPWKKPVPGDLSGRPLESVLDEALAPLDKDVFKRQVKYQGQAVVKQEQGQGHEKAAPDKQSVTPTSSIK